MILKVNPTRINLLNLKKDLKIAERGHKLLKDKRDGLMKEFMEIIKEARNLRQSLNGQISEAFQIFVLASSLTPYKTLETAFSMPTMQTQVLPETKTIMSVKTPRLTLKKEGSLFSYSFLETSGDLDNFMVKMDKILPEIIKLAEFEKTAESLAEEIEKTRRRVNALENTMIPNLRDTIRFISQRLEEQARDAVVSNMRIKSMILAKEQR